MRFQFRALSQSTAVGRLLVKNYVQSPWIVVELVLVLGIVAAAPSAGGDSTSGLFQIAAPAFLGQAAIGAVLFVRRAFAPSAYVLLAKLPSRRPLLLGLLGGVAAMRLATLLLMLVLGALLGRVDTTRTAFDAAAAAGVLLGGCVVAAAAVTLSYPIGSRRLLAAALLWFGVGAVPARDLVNLPLAAQQAHALLLAPLAPVFRSLPANSGWQPDLVSFAILLAYVAALALVAAEILQRRSLQLH